MMEVMNLPQNQDQQTDHSGGEYIDYEEIDE